MRRYTGYAEAAAWLEQRAADLRDPEGSRQAADIIEAVRSGGDAALSRYTRQLDGVDADITVPAAALEEAVRETEPRLLEAIRVSSARVRAYYERQLEHSSGFELEDEDGRLGLLVRPLDSVGCYVPGGQAPLFSTLIMSAVPALVAGVERVVLASPPGPSGLPHPAVLATASELGISEVHTMGGAQAVAALALGTESVRRVDKVVGPGNRFVMHAKRQLFGEVGIEALPGPTETLVLADASADVDHVVSDLLAQAEHAEAVPVFVTDDPDLFEAVLGRLPAAAGALPTARTALESLKERGAAVLVTDLAEGLQVANAFAPEHLCLLTADPRSLLPQVRNAGGIFLGATSMEALGDYAAGPSHIMPTGFSARFASFLNIRDFQKVIPLLDIGPRLLAEIGPDAALLARAEGLEAHARAIEARTD